MANGDLTPLGWIALGGALGAVSRYLVSGWTYRVMGEAFPWGTLAVNLVGCFLLGLLVQVTQASTLLPDPLRSGVTIGYLGAFTTYSTFGYETLRELEQGRWTAAGLNMGTHLVLGLAAVWLGMTLGRALVGHA